MSALMSNSTGNFTAAATWSLIEPTSFPTALATQETGTTNSTTSFVSSTSFTGIVAVADGIALKVSSRNAVPSGTFSVRLAIAGVPVPNSTVTVNVADIPNGIGWVFFKFGSTVAVAGASTYTVQISSSVNAQVTLFRKSATAADWTYALRTTTTQAPAAGDQLLTTGEWDSAGVNSSFIVTMDNTASTLFGPATTGVAALEISSKSTFQYGIAASTNYNFRIAGNLYVNNAGTFSAGTGASPVPSTSTAKLEIVGTSNVQFGIEARAGSNLNSGGNVITNSALLAADASAAATSLTTNVSTGWKNGDVIAIAATTRTRAECESKALTADASGTTLTITSLTNAHGGSAGVVAELINLTRNVSIFGTSSANQAYINIAATATVDLESTEFYNLGSATANKRGIDIATTTGSCTVNNCSIHDLIVASSRAINCNAAANNNITITNLVSYNIADNGVTTTAGTTTAMTFNNIICLLSGVACFSFGNLGCAITNITAVGGTTRGALLSQQATSGVFGTLNNFIAHSNTGPGVDFTNCTNFGNNPYGYVSNITAWRNTTFGLLISNTFDIIFDIGTLFGNATANFAYTASAGNTFVRNMVCNAGTTLTCPVGLQVANDTKETYVDNCTFGVTTAHATGDVQAPSANVYARLFLRNCLLNSTTPVATPGNLVEGSQISSARHQQTAGNHKTWKKFGTLTPDTTIFNRASPSERITPNNASFKVFSGYKKFAVPNGQTAVVNVFVRKSVAGDGSAYNGNQPRLIQKADAATGNNTDVVLATTTNAANGAFQLLTATIAAVNDDCVVQVYVDCDGTAGWVNIDDYSVNS